jgi:hypothetical protein
LPILHKVADAYKLWQTYIRYFPKDLRYTLGGKIDLLFIEVLESLFAASYLIKEQKQPHLQRAAQKLDLLKFFLQLSWECKALDIKKFVNISELTIEIGRMLGGWQKQVITKANPAYR